MIKLLTVVVFLWLLFQTVGLTFKLTWGVAKIVAGILMVLALPMLILSLVLVGGALLLVPIIMVCVAAGIAKACIRV